jgi:hypothetical protein
LFDAIRDGSLVHAGQEPLDDAAKLSAIKAFGDGWLFDRKKSPVDAAPILAVAEALWLLSTVKPKPKRRPPRRLR